MDVKETVLIADSDSDFRSTLIETLEEKGYSTISASNIATALALINEKKPGIALIDLAFEDVANLDLMRKICNCSQDTKCIVMAEPGMEALAIDAINQGVVGCLQKRYFREQLTQLIRRAIEEKKQIHSLVESNRWYRQMVENSPNPIFAVDSEYRIRFWNESCKKVFKYNAEQAIGQVYDILLAQPESFSATSSIVKSVFDDQSLTDVQIEFNCQDGKSLYSSSLLYPLYNQAGEVRLCVFSNTEITESKHAQEALRTSVTGSLGVESYITQQKTVQQELRKGEETYRLLIERSPFGIVVSDHKGKIIEANPTACRISGFKREDLLGKNGIDFLTDDNQQWARHFIEEVTSDSHIEDAIVEIKNGKMFRINTAVFQQDPLLMYSTIEDVTDQQRVEQQLRQSQKMEAIGTLAGGVAHDINNVLAAVMSLASVLEEEFEKGDKRLKDIHDILDACRRGRDLTRDLLGFARRGKHLKQMVSLNDTVCEIASLLKRMISKKIIIKTQLDEHLNIVEGDPGQLNHALMNVCINAAESIPSVGTLTITTSNILLEEADIAAYQKLNPGEYVELKVHDTGVGMGPNTFEHCFDPFFTTKPKGKGTGLGLSMVYGTITNHGGVVVIDSQLAKGTVVTILLPAIRQLRSEPPIPKRKIASSSIPNQSTVLLVDDEKMIRKAGMRLLGKLGYKVLLAEDGKQAIDIYRKNKDEISLVILDLIMPVMNGSETLARLRDIDPKVPIMLSSGYSREEIEADLLKPGLTGFMQKPFDLEALSNEITEIFGVE